MWHLYRSYLTERNLEYQIKFTRKLQIQRLSGKYNLNIKRLLSHEMTHYYHWLQRQKRGIYLVDTRGIMKEGVTLLNDSRGKTMIRYPGRDVFLADQVQYPLHPPLLYAHAYYSALTIALNYCRKKGRLGEVYVKTRKKEKFIGPDLNFSNVMEDRPFFIRNIPPDMTDYTIKKIVGMSLSKYVVEYEKAAKRLGIPKKYWLLRLPWNWRYIPKRFEDKIILGG